MANKKRFQFRVSFAGFDRVYSAATAGAAARAAFREAINEGVVKRQPRTDSEGGWKGVSIGLV